MKIKLLSLFFATCLAVSGTSALDWESLGPFGSGGYLAMAPRDSNIIYCLSVDQGVYKSTDRGTFWSWMKNGYDASDVSFIGLDISQSNPDILYFINSRGQLYKTEDGGETWRKINKSKSLSQPIYIDPKNSDHLFCGCFPGGEEYLTISHDGGKNWFTVDHRLGNEIHGIIFSECDPGVILLGAGAEIGYSSDNGETWLFRDAEIIDTPYFIQKMVADPWNPTHVFAMIYAADVDACGIHESNDGGFTWKQIRQEISIQFDVNFTVQPPKIYSQTGSSFDGGQTWQDYRIKLEANHSMLLDPRDPDFALFSDWNTTCRITADGKHWYPQAFFVDLYLESVKMDPCNNDVIYILGLDSGVHKTVDGGQTWRAASAGLFDSDGFKCMELDEVNPNVLYCVGPYVYKSDDKAETWRVILDLKYPQSIWIDPTDHQILYCSIWDSNDRSVYFMRSNNGGETWKKIWTSPVTPSRLYEVVCNRYFPGLLYIKKYYDADSTGEIYVSGDYGETWSVYTPNIHEDTQLYAYEGMVCDPFAANRVYLLDGPSHGLLVSEDYGMNWTNPDPKSTYLFYSDPRMLVDPGSPNTIYVSDPDLVDEGYFYRTLEGGSSWTLLDTGIYGAFNVVHEPDQTILYAARNREDINVGVGLFKTVLKEEPCRIITAGYGQSRLSADKSGKLAIFCDVAVPETASLPLSVELYYENIPTGLFLNDDGIEGDEISGDDRYSIAVDVPPIGSSFRLQFELIVRDSTGVVSDRWPKLHVK